VKPRMPVPFFRSSFRSSVAALALGGQILAGLACAHSPASAEKPQRARVMVTGSRIPQYVDAGGGLPATAAPVRIYTRDELRGTGRPALGAALGALEPGAR